MDDRQPRITIAHSMEVSYTTLDAQAGLSYDTTIRLTVDPMGMYPDPQAVCLLWIASNHIFKGMSEFDEFRDTFEEHALRNWSMLIDMFPQVFGQADAATRRMFAKAKPVAKRPPWSKCPRCGKPIWAEEGRTELAETRRLLKEHPYPLWCRTCGQRFAYSDGQIECTSRFGIQETLDTLDAMFPVDQPSIDTILIESRAEGGE